MKKAYWSAVIYIIYASIVLVIINNERMHGSEFWAYFIGYMITIPLIIGSIVYLVYRYYYGNGDFIDEIMNAPEEKTEENTLFYEDLDLISFSLEYGPKMQVGKLKNKDGKTFHICRFINEQGKETRVYFFSQLGELTPTEIEQKKQELYVGKMINGKYYLHGKDSVAWENVAL